MSCTSFLACWSMLTPCFGYKGSWLHLLILLPGHRQGRGIRELFWRVVGYCVGLGHVSFLGMLAFAHCMCFVLCLNFSVFWLLVWDLLWQSAVSTACCFPHPPAQMFWGRGTSVFLLDYVGLIPKIHVGNIIITKWKVPTQLQINQAQVCNMHIFPCFFIYA